MRILSGAIVILAAATVFAGTMIYSGLIKAVEIQLRGADIKSSPMPVSAWRSSSDSLASDSC